MQPFRAAPTIVFVLLFAVASPRMAVAQPVRAYAGVGGALIFDAAPRVVLGGISDGDSSHELIADGGVFVAPRVALGVEAVWPDTVQTSTQGHFGVDTKSESETQVSGIVHVEVIRTGHAVVAAVAGGGVLRATTTQTTVPNDPRSTTTVTTTNATLPAMVAGVDLLVAPSNHVAAGPIVRFYWPHGETPAPTFPGQTFSFAEQASSRIAIGIVGRATW